MGVRGSRWLNREKGEVEEVQSRGRGGTRFCNAGRYAKAKVKAKVKAKATAKATAEMRG
jgi:hypothetical protein